jgi:hypothetical protein
MLQAIELEPDPETILDTIAAVTRQRGVVPDRWCGDGRSMVVVLGTEHQKRLLDGGWTKQAIQAYLWERVTAEATGKFDRGSYLARPENVLVVAAGGPGLAVSWVLTPHLSNPVSKVIGAPS